MYNVATIYRFNTPFLNLSDEKTHLLWVMKKIEKSIAFDWIWYDKKTIKEWNYYKIILDFNDNLWQVDFYYISDAKINDYHLPVFKLNIDLNESFLLDNESKKRAIKFLNNIFECFDWLNEREFLIDINNNLYFTSWFFKTKRTADYDFSDIEKIRNLFETKDWMALVEDFIKKFSWKEFELTYEKSEYYHKLHSIFLYFVYLVFLMYQNIERTNNAKKELDNTVVEWLYEWQIDLMKERLTYVEELHKNTFEQYKNRLELFFKMF